MSSSEYNTSSSEYITPEKEITQRIYFRINLVKVHMPYITKNYVVLIILHTWEEKTSSSARKTRFNSLIGVLKQIKEIWTVRLHLGGGSCETIIREQYKGINYM